MSWPTASLSRGEELYTEPDFAAFLSQQDAVNILLADGVPAGYYILHPNNIGRCGHVANASYLMDKRFRGQKLGRPLVDHSVEAAKALGFRGMQFNAVVAGNRAALSIYQAAGFRMVGTIPGGVPAERRGIFGYVYPVPAAGLRNRKAKSPLPLTGQRDFSLSKKFFMSIFGCCAPFVISGKAVVRFGSTGSECLGRGSAPSIPAIFLKKIE